MKKLININIDLFFFNVLNLNFFSWLIFVLSCMFFSLFKVSRDIVIHGSNIGLTISKLRLSLLIRKMFNVPEDQMSVLVGNLLSDGSLSKQKARGTSRIKVIYPRFSFSQSLSHFSYFWLVFWSLRHYCGSMPSLGVRFSSKGTKLFSLKFSTRALPCFSDIYNMFYNNGKKVVPNNIYNLLTPIALAHWIMGDGQSYSYGLQLCTDSFTKEEVERLISVLVNRYGLYASLRKMAKEGQYRIYINRNSMNKLNEIVKSYMVDSMLYKITPKNKI